jgi:hypothetical protein
VPSNGCPPVPGAVRVRVRARAERDEQVRDAFPKSNDCFADCPEELLTHITKD